MQNTRTLKSRKLLNLRVPTGFPIWSFLICYQQQWLISPQSKSFSVIVSSMPCFVPFSQTSRAFIMVKVYLSYPVCLFESYTFLLRKQFLKELPLEHLHFMLNFPFTTQFSLPVGEYSKKHHAISKMKPLSLKPISYFLSFS